MGFRGNIMLALAFIIYLSPHCVPGICWFCVTCSNYIIFYVAFRFILFYWKLFCALKGLVRVPGGGGGGGSVIISRRNS